MSAANLVLKEIASDMETILNKCGIMYHVFYILVKCDYVKSNFRKLYIFFVPFVITLLIVSLVL